MADQLSGKIQTVLGLIEPGDLGSTLTHEHIHNDATIWAKKFKFPAPDYVKDSWNASLTMENLWWIRHYPYSIESNIRITNEFDAWTDELKFYLQNGGRSIVDVTNRGIGRNINNFVKLSKASGVHIISGTGWYRAQTHPSDMTSMSLETLTQVMVDDITKGADGSDAKCGVIGEVGCSWPFEANEKKVLQATAATQEQLGCPVIIHPGFHIDSPAEIIRILQEAGGDISKTVMSHLDGLITTKEELIEIAQLGSYLEFDFFGWEISYLGLTSGGDTLSDAQRIKFFKDLVDEGFEDKMVMAHDIHLKSQLMKYGGHGYSHILLNVIPKMLQRGITQTQIDKFTTHNPRRWLTFK